MSPAMAVLRGTKEAEERKEEGNSLFKRSRYGAAIEAYTQAIELCPNVPVYYTNRALCHRKRDDWENVESDCRTAIQLDHNLVKGHYMLGLALLERLEFTEGIKELQLALDLGRAGANPRSYIVEEIRQELARAKYEEWERESSLHLFELQKLKEACQSALKEKQSRDVSQVEGFSDEFADAAQLQTLERVFKTAAEGYVASQVPDHFCCQITLDIFRDPVIAPSGITYERAAVLDHLQKVGHFDPVTRQPLNQSQLIPNLAVKEAVQAFLDKHGWAYNGWTYNYN